METPVILHGLDTTKKFAIELASEVQPGDTIALIGTLAAGKTHLAKFLVEALGCDAHVSSPTFTLINEYPAAEFRIAHFDFYRINSERELIEIGWDEYLTPSTVNIVEWANRFPDVLPENTRWFSLEAIDKDSRRITELASPPEAFLDD